MFRHPRSPGGVQWRYLTIALFGKKKSGGEDHPEVAGGDAAAVETSKAVVDPAKARRFFEHAEAVHETHRYEYAMTLWLQGLRWDPDNTEALERFSKSAAAFLRENPKAKGPTKDQVKAFSGKGTLERYLGHLLHWGASPESWQHGLKAMEQASKLELSEATYWIGERVLGVAASSAKKKKDTFVQLMELFSSVGGFDKAVIAGEIACQIDPTDAKLQAQVRNMSAQATMSRGGFEDAGQEGGFRSNVRDISQQRALEEEERLVKSEDVIDRVVTRAQAEYESRPTDAPSINKYAKALLERGTPDDEKLAYQLLMKAYQETQEFRFRQQAGDIKLRLGRRKLREMKAMIGAEPDEKKQQQLAAAELKLLEAEIEEYAERVKAYPTDLGLRYELGRRYFQAKDFEKAIEQFQIAQDAPAHRSNVLSMLGQSFAQMGWLDEAEATFRRALDSHENKDDNLGLELRYFLMRTLGKRAEEHNELDAAEEAFKLAAGVAIKQINFRDIRAQRERLQELVKQLKTAGAS